MGSDRLFPRVGCSRVGSPDLVSGRFSESQSRFPRSSQRDGPCFLDVVNLSFNSTNKNYSFIKILKIFLVIYKKYPWIFVPWDILKYPLILPTIMSTGPDIIKSNNFNILYYAWIYQYWLLTYILKQKLLQTQRRLSQHRRNNSRIQ
jgi:hypothetical protein